MLKRLRQEYSDVCYNKDFSTREAFQQGMIMRRTVLTVAIILLMRSVLAYGWPWSTDMSRQPSIKPQRAPRVPPPNSIPIQGKEMPIDRVEAGKKLHNPVKSTLASVENGKLLFHIYCSPCHGTEAKGDGPVGKKFVSPTDLTLEVSRNRPDGYIFATIREGGSTMPSQADGLSPQETWDVVNYLRSLQKNKR
jgi:S-disulfanyl-L-cysteine oxidoreductase SoxD